MHPLPLSARGGEGEGVEPPTRFLKRRGTWQDLKFYRGLFFLGGGSRKTNVEGHCLKMGRLGHFADLRGVWQETGVGRVDTPVHTMKIDFIATYQDIRFFNHLILEFYCHRQE